jgi:hypothetical protein
MTIVLLIFIAVALGHTPTYLSFNTGQVSPLIEARVDFQKYSSSCRTIENMFVTVHGPAERRPGTKFISDVYASGQYGFGAYGRGVYGE